MRKQSQNGTGHAAERRRARRVGQTRERRIYLTWRAVKARYDYRSGEGVSVWYRVAQRWRMPIREVMAIVQAEREKRP